MDPIPVARAEGVCFWTPEGTRFLDFAPGAQLEEGLAVIDRALDITDRAAGA